MTQTTAVVCLASLLAALHAAPAEAKASKRRTVTIRRMGSTAPARISGVTLSPFTQEAAEKSTTTDLLTPARDRVELHIDSDGEPLAVGHLSEDGNNAILGETRGAKPPSYHRLCETPCVLHVPRGRFFVSAGEDGQQTALLDVAQSNIQLRISAPSRGLGIAASVLMAVGGVSALGGGILLPVGLALAPAGTAEALRLGGGVGLAAGLALLIPGIIIAAINRGAIQTQEVP